IPMRGDPLDGEVRRVHEGEASATAVAANSDLPVPRVEPAQGESIEDRKQRADGPGVHDDLDLLVDVARGPKDEHPVPVDVVVIELAQLEPGRLETAGILAAEVAARLGEAAAITPALVLEKARDLEAMLALRRAVDRGARDRGCDRPDEVSVDPQLPFIGWDAGLLPVPQERARAIDGDGAVRAGDRARIGERLLPEDLDRRLGGIARVRILDAKDVRPRLDHHSRDRGAIEPRKA